MRRTQPIGAEAQREQSREQRAARKKFAREAAERISAVGLDPMASAAAVFDAWLLEAKVAKALGFYAPSTHAGDVAIGLQNHWRREKQGGRR